MSELLELELRHRRELWERERQERLIFASLLLSSLELSDTKSMSLKYEPASEPLHISVK